MIFQPGQPCVLNLGKIHELSQPFGEAGKGAHDNVQLSVVGLDRFFDLLKGHRFDFSTTLRKLAYPRILAAAC
jgi:hypothetical protein